MPALSLIVPGDLRTATGGYAYDRRIVAGLRELGWQVAVHSLDASFPQPTPGALSEAAEILAALPDDALVLVDGLALGAMPDLVAAEAARLRLIALVHHPLAAETGLQPEHAEALKLSEARALRHVRHVVVTSAATAQALRPYGVAAERISVVQPGTDARPLARSRGDGVLRLLCVATLTPRKAHEVLIKALADVRQPNWQLICVGSLDRSPATVEQLRHLIRQYGLESRVSLAGELDDAALAACFLDADLFVSPTRFEGYGMVVAEALAHGLPVLSTPSGAIAELLDAKAGLLVPADDVQALRLALERLLGDAALLAACAAGARQVREYLPGWSQVCRQMADVLQKFCPP